MTRADRRAAAAIARNPDTKLVHAMAGLAFLAALAPQMPLLAQGLDSRESIDSIVGSDVETEKESAAADREQLVSAIENTSDSISEVRKSFSLDKVEIVFLPDFSDSDQALKSKLDEHKAEIGDLRDAIEGNAMFFHAVDSRSVMLKDIIAVTFTDDNGVKIYTAGQPPAE